MTAWTKDELTKIGETEDLQISPCDVTASQPDVYKDLDADPHTRNRPRGLRNRPRLHVDVVKSLSGANRQLPY